MPHTSSTRLKSLSLRLSSQSRTSGSSSKLYSARFLSLTPVTVLMTADSAPGIARGGWPASTTGPPVIDAAYRAVRRVGRGQRSGVARQAGGPG